MGEEARTITRRELLAGGGAALVAGAVGCVLPGAAKPPDRLGLVRTDALGLARLVRRGEITPGELLEWSIERAEALNPSLNAIVVEDFDRARRRVGRGELGDGPLRGVPFLLKDLGVALEGTVTTNGSRFFADAVARRTSTLVERYQSAGLVIYGKTASPEFGSSSSTESLLFGATQNPWVPDYSPGGSSGGSAVAVAVGIVPAAHASDGGGSIRIPASCCGVFGLKPSRGRTPQGPGLFDRAAGLSIDHVVSRTVRDSAALLDVSQGPALGDPYVTPPRVRPYLEEVGRDPGRLRIGLQRRAALPVETHPDCLRAVEETALLCEQLGHRVEEIDPPPLPEEGLWGVFGILRGTAIAIRVAARERELGRAATPDDLEPGNWRDHRAVLEVDAIGYERARQEVYALARDVVAHQADFDVVLSPTLASPPPRLGVLDPSNPGEAFAQAAMSMAGFTIAYNVSGQPAMSVPLHTNEAGLPIGSMFVAGPAREDRLFRLAAQLEEARPWRDRWPTIAGVGVAAG